MINSVKKKAYETPKISVVKFKVYGRLMEASRDPIYHGPAASNDDLDDLDRSV